MLRSGHPNHAGNGQGLVQAWRIVKIRLQDGLDGVGRVRRVGDDVLVALVDERHGGGA